MPLVEFPNAFAGASAEVELEQEGADEGGVELMGDAARKRASTFTERRSLAVKFGWDVVRRAGKHQRCASTRGSYE